MNDEPTHEHWSEPHLDQGAGALLSRATDDLLPDVERLVAVGVQRGRRLRRRRTIATGAGALASVAVVGALTALAVSGPGGSDHAVDPAASQSATSTSTSTSTPTLSPTDDAPRQLAVTGRTIPDTFAQLHPGTVKLSSTKEIDSPDPVVDFTWNGYAVRVGLTSDDFVTGTRIPDPMRRCLAEGGGPAPCTPGPDGTVLQIDESTGPAVDGGVTVRMVSVFRPNGWDVLVSAANAADDKGSPVLAPEPPFTLAQLQADAESDVWFK